MASISLITLLLITLLLTCRSTNPSIVLNLTDQALTNIKTHVLPDVITKILSIPLPDIKENVWPFTISVSQLMIKDLNLKVSDIALDLVPNEISIVIQNVAVNVEGNLVMESLVTSEGTLKVELSEISVGLSVALALNAANKLQISLSNINVNIGQFKLSIDGSFFIEFINLFIELFENLIKTQVQQQIILVLQNQVPSFVNDLLVKIPSDYKLSILGAPLALNIQPTSAPIIRSNSIEIDILGFVYDPLLNKTIPEPTVFNPISHEQQIQATVSQTLINSVFSSLVEAEALWSVLVNIPNTNYTMKTDYIDYFLPGVVAKYGADVMVIFVCSVPVAPELDFKHPLYDVSLQVNITCEINPIVKSNPTPIGNLTFNLNVSLDVLLENNTIAINFTDAFCDKLDIINTEFTDKQHLNYLQETINLAMKFGLKAIEPKMEIPEVQGIIFNDTAIQFGDGFISIETTPDLSKWILPEAYAFENFYKGFKWVKFLDQEVIYSTFLDFNKGNLN